MSILPIEKTLEWCYNIITASERAEEKSLQRKEREMRRFDIDKAIKASSIEKATEKFCKILRDRGLIWAADEMTESVSNGFVCCSNAMEHTLKINEVTSPKTNDWSYYWAIEEIGDKEFYAWFIERQ